VIVQLSGCQRVQLRALARALVVRAGRQCPERTTPPTARLNAIRTVAARLRLKLRVPAATRTRLIRRGGGGAGGVVVVVGVVVDSVEKVVATVVVVVVVCG
jgi:hypothetical protein